ncbi:hypothetical protein F5X97DRAFT_334192 [Nemania serpens]|nr:hypothetical protein F5X97DRAFT_334192 [Nemania serpens]
MSPQYHGQDPLIVPTKGKEKEFMASASVPSGLHIASSRRSLRRPDISQSTFVQPQTTQGGYAAFNTNQSSNTWTSSSENPDLPPGEDGEDDRAQFVLEYNQLAQRGRSNGSFSSRRSSWLSKMLRQASEQSQQTTIKPDNSSLRHQRGLGDVTSNFGHNHKQDGLKNQDLRALIRLCGKSPLFLPTDYAPFSLMLPTCIRALAQALVQHGNPRFTLTFYIAETRGIFRIPGSTRVVNTLYDYYCTYGDTDSVSSTTRCPTLPTHIRCDAHDIASTFKKFLAGLPGGILGSLSLFDALVAIHSQLQGDAEVHWTKESKLRARLIALAIGTVKSQNQRELICAVFGLLCLVGRVAKNAPREDESGRPLPSADLMGYNALGIVFGPLLIGDAIDNYQMKMADPSAGLVLLPVSPPRSRKERHKHRHKHGDKVRRRHAKRHAADTPSSFTVDKIHIANSITEMLIVHWREVVVDSTPSSTSENFCLQIPPHLGHAHPRSVSSSTASPTPTTSRALDHLNKEANANGTCRDETCNDDR